MEEPTPPCPPPRPPPPVNRQQPAPAPIDFAPPIHPPPPLPSFTEGGIPTPPAGSRARAEHLVRRNAEATIGFFGPPSSALIGLPPTEDEGSTMARMSSLYNDAYRGPKEREEASKQTAKRIDVSMGVGGKQARAVVLPVAQPDAGEAQGGAQVGARGDGEAAAAPDAVMEPVADALPGALMDRVQRPLEPQPAASNALTTIGATPGIEPSELARLRGATSLALRSSGGSSTLSTSLALAADRPDWHPPWKLFRSISGHHGWVRSIAVDPTNAWFATGSADKTIKIWDVASGRLKLTLTGHIAAVHGLAVSARHPYLFSVGEDKTVKCWDLETNSVVRSYHGHLSGVYSVALHPALDVLMTGGRDSAVRVWDMRSRSQIFALAGHRDTINDLKVQSDDPQVISASVDSTVRLWDLPAGKCSSTLTNHKRGVRALALHPTEFSFASASFDNIKTWGLPTGAFMRNFGGQHKKLVNCLAVNADGVLVSGGDDGSMRFWDWKGAHCFQTEQAVLQPGSMECESAIYAMEFDHSGSRLITAEGDKTVKMWKEDVNATPETHPVEWKPNLRPQHY